MTAFLAWFAAIMSLCNFIGLVLVTIELRQRWRYRYVKEWRSATCEGCGQRPAEPGSNVCDQCFGVI